LHLQLRVNDWYHVAQVPPLVEKVPVHIDAVRFREVLGDQLADGGEVRLLAGAVVLDITQLSHLLLRLIFLLAHGPGGSREVG
jgi:hypothetical protein